MRKIKKEIQIWKEVQKNKLKRNLKKTFPNIKKKGVRKVIWPNLNLPGWQHYWQENACLKEVNVMLPFLKSGRTHQHSLTECLPNGPREWHKEWRTNPLMWDAKGQLMFSHDSKTGRSISGLERNLDKVWMKAVCPDERCWWLTPPLISFST